MNAAVILKSQFADNTNPKRWRKKIEMWRLTYYCLIFTNQVIYKRTVGWWRFYAIPTRDSAMGVLSVRPSVRQSYSCVEVFKSSNFFHRLVGPSLYFLESQHTAAQVKEIVCTGLRKSYELDQAK